MRRPRSFGTRATNIITLEKLIERDYKVPEVQTAQELISYYAKRCPRRETAIPIRLSGAEDS
jgi:hypothetical protein